MKLVYYSAVGNHYYHMWQIGGGRIRTRNLQGMSLMSFSNNYSTPLGARKKDRKIPMIPLKEEIPRIT